MLKKKNKQIRFVFCKNEYVDRIFRNGNKVYECPPYVKLWSNSETQESVSVYVGASKQPALTVAVSKHNSPLRVSIDERLLESENPRFYLDPGSSSVYEISFGLFDFSRISKFGADDSNPWLIYAAGSQRVVKVETLNFAGVHFRDGMNINGLIASLPNLKRVECSDIPLFSPYFDSSSFIRYICYDCPCLESASFNWIAWILDLVNFKYTPSQYICYKCQSLKEVDISNVKVKLSSLMAEEIPGATARRLNLFCDCPVLNKVKMSFSLFYTGVLYTQYYTDDSFCGMPRSWFSYESSSNPEDLFESLSNMEHVILSDLMDYRSFLEDGTLPEWDR